MTLYSSDETYLLDISSPNEVNFSRRLQTLSQELKTIDKKIYIVSKVGVLPAAFSFRELTICC